jgi:hypothetical protein
VNDTLAFIVAVVMIVLASSVLSTKMHLDGDLTRADGLLVFTGAVGVVLAVVLAGVAMTTGGTA